jgi:hypothetical protein
MHGAAINGQRRFFDGLAQRPAVSGGFAPRSERDA